MKNIKRYIREIILKENFEKSMKITKEIANVTPITVDFDPWAILNFSKKMTNKFHDKGFTIKAGAERVVFIRDDYPFVIKVAKSKDGVFSNIKELGQESKSLNVKNILPKIYDYDRKNMHPLWITAEKVIDLKIISENNTKENEELFASVFPTYYNVCKEVDPSATVKKIISIMCNSLVGVFSFEDAFGSNVVDLMHLSLKEALGTTTKRKVYLEKLINGDIPPNGDVIKIAQCMQYDFTSDIKPANIGIKIVPDPSPESIVVLDFNQDNDRIDYLDEY